MRDLSMAYGGPPKPGRGRRPPFSKRSLRVVSRVDEEGKLCVKIYVDGVFVTESSGDAKGTVNVEIEV